MRSGRTASDRQRERLAEQFEAGKATLGGFVDPRRGHMVDVAGDCTDPVVVDAENRVAAPRDAKKFQGKLKSTTVYLTRCRKCEPCRKAHAGWWFYRANREIEASTRSWFGTLTLTPEAHERIWTRAKSRLQSRGYVDDDFTPEREFVERHKAISGELTKWLKRVRAQSAYERKLKKVPLRYCLVVEQHTGKRRKGVVRASQQAITGKPHYHILIHEDGVNIPHRILRDQWPHGHVKFNLVPEGEDASRAAHYVAKYLSKCSEARVRASLRYGFIDEDQ